MLPARDRITVLKVYSSKADALADTNGTSYSEGIVNGTARIERTFYRALPAFGECNAAMFECELSINTDLKGKWIRVATQAYATDAATSRTTYWLFCGLVDDCKYDARQATRKVVAYDEMYTLRNTDVSSWWKTYFSSQQNNVAAGTAITAMMNAFSVSGNAGTAYGSYFSIIPASQIDAFSGCSFAQMLEYFGLVKPCSFYFDVNGQLRMCDYASVNKTSTATAVDTDVDTVNSAFGDAANSEFGSAVINVGSETSYRDGSTEPTFTQTDNPLLYGQTAATYILVAQGLLTAAKKMSGLRSAEIELIVSTNDVLDHAAAISYNGVTYMASGIAMYGDQFINETITCTNELSDTPSYRQSITTENIADGAVRAEKIKVDDLNALHATIAGWNIGTNKISKTVNGKVAEISSEIPKVLMSSENHYAEVNGNAEITTYYGGGQWADVSQGETVMKGQEISQDYDVWEVHATYADWVRKSESSLTDATLTLKGREIDPETLYLEDNFHTAVLDERDLTFDGHSLKRLTPHLSQMWSTLIPANANLNTTTYLKVGQYCCFTSPDAATLSNCPTNVAFCMTVLAPFSSEYDKETSSTWQYRVRKIVCYNGEEYVQAANSNGSRVWTYNAWRKVVDVGTNEYKRFVPHLYAGYATVVPSGANLNTTTYLKIGEYSLTTAVAQSCSSYLPFATESRLTVYTPSGTTYDDESGTWKYRVREYETWDGKKWRQLCQVNGTAGNWTFGAWQKVITDGDTPTTGTATKNTTYIGATGTVKWTKFGRVVHLQGSFYAKSAMYSAGGRNLFTGVPAAYSGCECLAIPVGDSSYYNSNIIPLVIDSSGNVIANFSGTRLFDEEVPFIIDTTYIS